MTDIGYSASFTVDTGCGNLKHNNREFIAKNVDKDRVNQDVVLVRESLGYTYMKVFGEAVNEYNAKQKREERKIKDYLEKLQGTYNKTQNKVGKDGKKTNNATKPFCEFIVQIGNADKPISQELGKEVYSEFLKRFQKANLNIVVFNAVIHNDEATPHLHVNYIPVARSYKIGLKVRNSMSMALKEMGYTQGKAALQIWEADNRKLIRSIAEEHGLTIEDMDCHRPHMSIAQYKEMQRLEERKQKELLAETTRIVPEKGRFLNKGKVLLREEDYNKLCETIVAQKAVIDTHEALSYPEFKRTQEENAELKKTIQTKIEEAEMAKTAFNEQVANIRSEADRQVAESKVDAEKRVQAFKQENDDHVARLIEWHEEETKSLTESLQQKDKRLQEQAEKYNEQLATKQATIDEQAEQIGILTKQIQWVQQKIEDFYESLKSGTKLKEFVYNRLFSEEHRKDYEARMAKRQQAKKKINLAPTRKQHTGSLER
jgi:hypothetical protein